MVPMGGEDLDQRVLASLPVGPEHGGDQWWLFVSTCTVCGQGWMIAQESRLYDNYYLRRISPAEMVQIADDACWPDDFLTFEKILRLGRTMSTPPRFLDPRSPGLVWTAEDLRRERPDISTEEIAYLLGVPVAQAKRLSQ